MTSEQIKAVWAAKITSFEEFRLALNKTVDHSREIRNVTNVIIGLTGDGTINPQVVSTESWFVRREAIREAVGVYQEPSTVLTWLRSIGLHQYFPHISKEDPKMVAYTIDRVNGLADKQVRTTMGKLLRKFLLVVTDAEIARLEAQHRADMDTTFELATTLTDIQASFAVAGDSSCMRYKKSHWGLREYHPSAVYSGPGMGIAYTRNASGEVNARTVVWTNPEDANDKRYVRIYGDQALKRRLENSGYRMAGLAGAKLAALKDSAYPDQYVMPWVDPAGGIYGSGADRSLDSSHVIKYKGEDFLRLVSDAEATRLTQAGLPVAYVRQQAGRIPLGEIDLATLQYVCALTGQASDRMQHISLPYLLDDGTVGQARRAEISPRTSTLRSIYRNIDNSNVQLYTSQEAQDKFCVPGFSSYFNDEPTRQYAGVVQLDAALYGENQYLKTRDTRTVEGMGRIKTVDAMRVFNADSEERYEHINAVKALRKQGYVATAVIGKVKAMSHTGNPDLVTTAGGRKVLKGEHSIIQMHDGRWEYNANTVSSSYLDMAITVPKDDKLTAVRLTAAQIEERVGRRLHSSVTLTSLRSRTMEYLSNGLATTGGRYPTTYYCSASHPGQVLERVYYHTPTPQETEAAAHRIIELSADPVQLNAVVGTYKAEAAVFWAHHALLILAVFNAEVSNRAIAAAEAAAVEAPHYLTNDDALLMALAA